MTVEQPSWSPPPPAALVQPQIAPGWYPDTTGAMRFWDGTQFTQHVPPPMQPAFQPDYRAGYGQPQTYMQPGYMVTKSRKQTNHTFHLLMTVITFGLWGVFVWFPITIYNAMRHDKATTRIYG